MLARLWWVPLIAFALIVGASMWVYRERPLVLTDLADQVIQGSEAWEREIRGTAVPPRMEIRSKRTTSLGGRTVESEVRTIIEALDQGWVRRTDNWYDGGAQSATYQERALLHRNLYQAHVRSREMAPFIHDLLGEFGWTQSRALTSSVDRSGHFPDDLGSSLTIDQSRIEQDLVLRSASSPGPFRRTTTCRRVGAESGSSAGPALQGSLAAIECSTSTSDGRRSGESSYVYLREAGIFLLTKSRTTHRRGGIEMEEQHTVKYESIRSTDKP